VQDRAKNGTSNFLCELSKTVKSDPVLSLAEVVEVISPKVRRCGEEVVAYVSSSDVETGTPFLL
jgi:hypothetical protein